MSRQATDRASVPRILLPLVDRSRTAAECFDTRKLPNAISNTVEGLPLKLEKAVFKPTIMDAVNMVEDAAGRMRVLGQDNAAKDLDQMVKKLKGIADAQDAVAATSWRCRWGFHAPGKWQSDTIVGRTTRISSSIEDYEWHALHTRTCTRCGRLEVDETKILGKAKIVCN